MVEAIKYKLFFDFHFMSSPKQYCRWIEFTQAVIKKRLDYLCIRHAVYWQVPGHKEHQDDTMATKHT